MDAPLRLIIIVLRHGGALADTTAKTGTLQGQGSVPKTGPLQEPRVFAVSVSAQHR